jgi:hypothetical protein
MTEIKNATTNYIFFAVRENDELERVATIENVSEEGFTQVVFLDSERVPAVLADLRAGRLPE